MIDVVDVTSQLLFLHSLFIISVHFARFKFVHNYKTSSGFISLITFIQLSSAHFRPRRKQTTLSCDTSSPNSSTLNTFKPLHFSLWWQNLIGGRESTWNQLVQFCEGGEKQLLCVSSGLRPLKDSAFEGLGLCGLWRRVLQRDLVNLVSRC